VTAAFTLDDLAEHWTDDVIPETERFPTTRAQDEWADNGFVIRDGLLDDDAMTAYEIEWMAHNAHRPGGWDYATPYMDHPALLELCCQPALAELLEELIGEPMGVHLNLTGWTSTRRDWHFDQYLNEPYVGAFYAAVWIALDDISPHAGPFQYIPGSHHWWEPISQHKMRAALGPDGDGPDWPTKSEQILSPLFKAEIDAMGIKPSEFLGHRGDMLVWHSRLLHRGSIPTNPHLERRALIVHFSGIRHRPDMPPAVQHPAGGWFFPLGGKQPVR
jgi:hypothetical protein